MGYSKTNRMIMRRVPSGVGGALGDFWDSVKGAGKSVLTFYNTSEQAVGGQAALQQAMTAQQAQANSGIDTTTLAIGGLAIAGLLIFALKK